MKKRLFRGSRSQIFFTAALVALVSMIVVEISTFLVHSKAQALFSKAGIEKIIKFDSSGFFPQTLTIEKGDTVTFMGKQEFWPASDPHPTHQGYPGFDPMKPLEKGDTWSFVFLKEGQWGYHDHLHPYFKGTIVVGNAKNLPSDTEEAIVFCEGKIKGGDAECFNNLIGQVIKKSGIKEGFDLFSRFYKTEPAFVDLGCHWAAHLVGEAAYARVARGEKLEITEATAYCGYGFYHGYIGALFHNDPDLNKVKNLCIQVGVALADKIPAARLNCFHGIGHGLVDDPPPREQWGKPDDILKQALSVCSRISDVPEEVGQCYEGAYNSLIVLDTAISGLSFESQDVIKFCDAEPLEMRYHCYYEMVQKMPIPQTVESILPFIQKVDPLYRDVAFSTIIPGMVGQRIQQKDQSYGVDGCLALPSQFKNQCIRGIVGGYFANGEPQKEYEKALLYCASPAFSGEEKKTCYTHALFWSGRMYSRDKVTNEVCPKLEKEYIHLCR